jgi:hypothetical protein
MRRARQILVQWGRSYIWASLVSYVILVIMGVRELFFVLHGHDEFFFRFGVRVFAFFCT